MRHGIPGILKWAKEFTMWAKLWPKMQNSLDCSCNSSRAMKTIIPWEPRPLWVFSLAMERSRLPAILQSAIITAQDSPACLSSNITIHGIPIRSGREHSTRYLKQRLPQCLRPYRQDYNRLSLAQHLRFSQACKERSLLILP